MCGRDDSAVPTLLLSVLLFPLASIGALAAAAGISFGPDQKETC